MFVRTRALYDLRILRRDVSQRRGKEQRLTKRFTSVWPDHLKGIVAVNITARKRKGKDDHPTQNAIGDRFLLFQRCGRVRAMIMHTLFATHGHCTPAFTERWEVVVVIATFGAWPIVAEVTIEHASSSRWVRTLLALNLLKVISWEWSAEPPSLFL